jgi:glycosyltransferase involved in cell wall biosynthesis
MTSRPPLRGDTSIHEHGMDLRDIHVCISAYACDPTRGSEPGIGWNIVREVARRHRVWAITRRKNEAAISAELQRAPLPKLRMIYFDVPEPLLVWKKGPVGIEVYYRLWQRLTRRLVEDLHRDVRLDLTQHVTFGRYWSPTALAYFSTPFIWGPVGGGETAPVAFRRDLDRRGRAYEFLRDCARRCGESAPSVRRAAHRTALGLAVTEETKARLLAMGTRRVEVFSAMGLDRAAYESFSKIPPPGAGPIRFISMGRLLHWKGFHLGLRAFAIAALPRSEYWIVGDGPERKNMSEMVRRFGLEGRVRFCGVQSRPDALEMLAACHVLVHPSLHDSGGWVCLEAMAAGKPVVCLDLGGPGEQVTDLTGVKVVANNPGQAVSDLARAMTVLGTNADLRHSMGEAGRRRVRDEYIWEKKGDRLEALYASVLQNTTTPAAATLA